MKVLYVSKYPPNQSGEAEYLKEIIEQTALASFCTIRVLAWKNGIDELFTNKNDDIKYKLYSKNSILRWFNPLIIIFNVFLYRPDVIHYQSSFERSLGGFCGEAAILANVICRIFNVKTVISYHSAGLPIFGDSIFSKMKTGYWMIMAKLFVKSFDYLNIVTAFDEKRYYSEFLRGVSVDCKKVYYENHFFYSGADARGIKKSRKNIKIKYCGFIRPDKGLDLLVDALRYVKHEVEVSIVGSAQSDIDREYISKVNSSISNLEKVKRFSIKNKYLTTKDFKREVNDCDILVIPYKMLSSVSGAALMGVSFGKFVVTTPVGIFSLKNPNFSKFNICVSQYVTHQSYADAIDKACLYFQKNNDSIIEKHSPDISTSFSTIESLYLKQYRQGC